MQGIYSDIKGFFSEYSVELILFIAGAIGSAIADSRSEVKLTNKQKVIRMFFGGATAVFLTELVVLLINTYTQIELSTGMSAGVGFFLGHIGMEGITSFMLSFKKKKENE